MQDTYKTILKNTEPCLYKDKGSKFYGYAFPVHSEEEITLHIENLKKEHHKARHWCYAWRMGDSYEQYRINDDGEPSGSAGLPIYGQIQSKEVTNILIVVVRYFGGTKLGMSGLVTAYKTAAQWVLEQSEIVTKTIDNKYQLKFSYTDMNKVQRIFKQMPVEILSQQMEMDCTFEIGIRKSECEKVIETIEELRCVQIKLME